MGNTPARGTFINNMGNSTYDEAIVNRGTAGRLMPLLKFHSVHGENVQLLNDARIARRKESFCKALAFSNRPIDIDEIVCISLCEVGTSWSGVLRFGVTNVDPASFRDIELPKFVCPDLTSKAGYWAKALAERYSIDKALLHFFVNSDGELHYGINGVSKGLFLCGINVHSPLWIVVDIYGNSVGVEFVDNSNVKLRSLSKVLRSKQHSALSPRIVRPSSTTDAEDTSTMCDEDSPLVAISSRDDAIPTTSTMVTSSTSASNLCMLSSIAGTTIAATNRQHSASARTSPFSHSTPQLTSHSSRMRFHTMKGANVIIEADDFTATRRHGEYNLGYVFTERPIRIDEIIEIVVLEFEPAFSGSLAFGITSCDPVRVAASRLPVDSDDLLERPEYWVCIKDVGAQPNVGDRLAFWLDKFGKVFFSKNGAPARVIMHVDVSVDLWIFFDLYGTTGKIQLIANDFDAAAARYSSLLSSRRRAQGPSFSASPSRQDDVHTTLSRALNHSSTPPVGSSLYSTPLSHRRNIFTEAMEALNDAAANVSISSSSNTSVTTTTATATLIAEKEKDETDKDGDTLTAAGTSECSICMNSRVNAVIYRCGHMCMCFSCAKELSRRSGDCPICRTPIIDVIRCYF